MAQDMKRRAEFFSEYDRLAPPKDTLPTYLRMKVAAGASAWFLPHAARLTTARLAEGRPRSAGRR
jgi:hypothetical protein